MILILTDIKIIARVHDKKIGLILAAIFASAIVLRLLYFPQNIYFGFDQARDLYATAEIVKGNPKLVGPPTTFEGLNHGVLYYYLYAPFYLIGGGDPAYIAAMLRVLNAAGVFLIFLLSTIIFNKYVGLISAFLFAISFEQTQFALYFNHPPFAVISILIMFLGLGILIFRQKSYGLIIALLGMGLSIQFEFLLTYLIVPFLAILFIFREFVPKIDIKTLIFSFGVFLLSLSTFILAEVKFSFRSLTAIYQLIGDQEKSLTRIIRMYLFEMGQIIKFNLTGDTEFKIIIGVVLIILLLTLLRSSVKKQTIFLSIWFFSVVIIYIISGGGDISTEVIQYHPNVGISLSLIIFTSYLLYNLGKKSYLVSLVIISFISFSNFSLIEKNNPYGSIPEINAQSFMLLSDETKILDFIYKESHGDQFAVKAITMPFYVNTTWSYLFEWYGKKKYGYLPVWNGKNALGFPGNLKVEDAQDKAPSKRFLIIEPVRGIPTYLIDDYLREESYFSDIDKEVEIGKFKVQVRHKI